MLRRAAGRSFSADRAPPSLGIHKTPFKSLPFFAELQTVLLDLTIRLPAQVNIFAQDDHFRETWRSGLRLS